MDTVSFYNGWRTVGKLGGVEVPGCQREFFVRHRFARFL